MKRQARGGTTKERDKGRLMNPRDIKRRANAIRKAMTGEPLYDRKYKDLRVADLLIVLEDDNYHSEGVVLEALATLDYYKIIEACELEVEQDKAECLVDELSERRAKLMKTINKGEE